HYFAGGRGGRSTFAAKCSICKATLPPAAIDPLMNKIESKRSWRTRSGIVLLDSWGAAINPVANAKTAFAHRNAPSSLQYLGCWRAGQAAAPSIAGPRRCHAAMSPYVSAVASQNYIDP